MRKLGKFKGSSLPYEIKLTDKKTGKPVVLKKKTDKAKQSRSNRYA